MVRDALFYVGREKFIARVDRTPLENSFIELDCFFFLRDRRSFLRV